MIVVLVCVSPATTVVAEDPFVCLAVGVSPLERRLFLSLPLFKCGRFSLLSCRVLCAPSPRPLTRGACADGLPFCRPPFPSGSRPSARRSCKFRYSPTRLLPAVSSCFLFAAWALGGTSRNRRQACRESPSVPSKCLWLRPSHGPPSLFRPLGVWAAGARFALQHLGGGSCAPRGTCI